MPRIVTVCALLYIIFATTQADSLYAAPQDGVGRIEWWHVLVAIVSTIVSAGIAIYQSFRKSRRDLANITNDQMGVLLKEKNVELEGLRRENEAYRRRLRNCGRDYYDATGDTSYIDPFALPSQESDA